MSRISFVPGVAGSPFQKTIAQNKAVNAGFKQLSGANFFSLDPELFELVRLRVAANNGCDY